MKEQVKIWAIGGDSLSAPEDTIPAYWAALAAGAEGLLIGVQLTADKKVVCCSQPDLRKTCGVNKKVGKLKLGKILKLDAGSQFRSIELDKRNQPIRGSRGNGKPWKKGAGSRRALFHPSLEEVCLHFGRRTKLWLNLLPSDDSRSASKELFGRVYRVLKSFGLDGVATLSGQPKSLKIAKGKKELKDRLVLRVENKSQARKAMESARELGVEKVWIDLSSISRSFLESSAEVDLVVGPSSNEFALTPRQQRKICNRENAIGLATRAIHDTKDVIQPRCVVLEDNLKKHDRKTWIIGHSRDNDDTNVDFDKGLFFDLQQGGEYSGAAAVTNFAIGGDFDSQVDFWVAHPFQGTTFELAVIQVDPGYHKTNLTFDVHGAPPYASSEKDENDGYRIGWNNGPAVTDFAADPAKTIEQLYSTVLSEVSPSILKRDPPSYIRKVPQSSNIYNNYSRDVGVASNEEASGQLRLVRHGSNFSAYYTDKYNTGWVMCGTARIPTLCNDVFFRLAAKHWPKGTNDRVPPWNQVRFSNFKILQRRLHGRYK